MLIDNPGATTLVLAIAILSVLHAAGVAVIVALAPLIFPPGVRSTGLALTYALGVAIFGGTATYVITWLVGVTGNPLASTDYVMAANVVVSWPLSQFEIPTMEPPAGRRRWIGKSRDEWGGRGRRTAPFPTGSSPNKAEFNRS